ncbi:MAG: hypothetical protein R3Y62_08090 [Eubacteriales bacterium]
MEQIDPRISQAVWSRVLGTSAEAPKTLSELLTEYTIAACRSQSLYRQIAMTSTGGLVRSAQGLYQLSTSQVRRLTAMYFLVQGATLPGQPRQGHPTDCLTKTLQRQYQTGQERFSEYRTSAHTYPEFSTFFNHLADEQGKIQEILMRLIASRL